MIHVKHTNAVRMEIILTGKSLERFKVLVNRALSSWPNAHPEIKEFGDMVTVGTVQQDYYAQANIVKSEEE
jgi:hypothetical protein